MNVYLVYLHAKNHKLETFPCWCVVLILTDTGARGLLFDKYPKTYCLQNFSLSYLRDENCDFKKLNIQIGVL